ncbi:MAG: Ig-like domain-containing protein [Candidatus Symbiothrix sp.]|nr:Ig-like domain-containing protein [Candidatus Symbiothrix sp.]
MKQRTKRNWVACLATLLLVLPAILQAQVHIGGNTDAVKGALLDLTTPEGSNLGLLPLNVYIDEIDQIPDVFTNRASIIDSDLQGLIVYNTNDELTDGAGLYVWDGGLWNKVEPAVVTVESVVITTTPTTMTSVGATQTLAATVTPSLAVTGATLTWASSNTAIATVNASTGVVTAVSSGTTNITASAGGITSAAKAVTVTIAVTGVTVSPTSATVIAAGATKTLTATVAPSTAAVKTVSWKSSNTAVATVSASGVVTGVASGTATITVTTTSGSKTATSAITVLPAGASTTRYITQGGVKFYYVGGKAPSSCPKAKRPTTGAAVSTAPAQWVGMVWLATGTNDFHLAQLVLAGDRSMTLAKSSSDWESIVGPTYACYIKI